MENHNHSTLKKQPSTELRIPIVLAWIMALLGLVLPFIIMADPLKLWNDSRGLFGAFLSIYTFIWILFLSDVIRSKIRSKPFWILAILIMPTIAQVVYLVRKKYILIPANETND
jgi:hypothetical protein